MLADETLPLRTRRRVTSRLIPYLMFIYLLAYLDRANVGVFLGETKLRMQYVGVPDVEGMRQINAAFPAGMDKGEQPCRVECGGVSTESRVLRVV